MKSQNRNSGGFQDTRTTRDRVNSGEIPKWLVDKLVSVGYSDPRKEYRFMTIVNVLCSLVAIFLATCSVFVFKVTMSHRTTSLGLVDIIAPAVVIGIFSATVVGYFFLRSRFEDRMEERTKRFNQAIERLIRSPRPQFTPANLISDHILLRSIEDALVDLAARKVIFLEYEKSTLVGMRRLSDAAHEDLGRLFDVGKELGVIGAHETYTRFFQRAEVFRIQELREEFNKMLAALPKGKLPPLFW